MSPTVQYIVKVSLHGRGRFISFHLLDLYLIGFSSFPAFSLTFHHLDIFDDEKYLHLLLGSEVLGSGVRGLGVWGPWVLGSSE